MTYEETLEFLYQQLPIFQRQGKRALKKDLTNTRLLCKALGNPHQKFNSIHVGGTNGKGSVSSMLASILTEAGYKVGLYTSPHLKSFTERIRINGQEIDQAFIVDFVAKTRDLIEEIQPSFFELTVAMAFEAFAKEEVDIAVVEVGLGGRLDSTNVITPELSIITHISKDHEAILGNTLEAIAGEKAGIIKPEIPVIIAETHIETQDVFLLKAEQTNSPISFSDQTHPLKRIGGDLIQQQFERVQQPEIPPIALSLGGRYQQTNLSAVLAAVDELKQQGWDISAEDVRKGLIHIAQHSGLFGRMQILGKRPLVVADTGHNAAGVKAVVEQLIQHPYETLHIVWGMVSDKDHTAILNLLPDFACYYFVCPDVPRGLPAQELQQLAGRFNLLGKSYQHVSEGVMAAKKMAKAHDLIWIGGSTFVVAEVIP